MNAFEGAVFDGSEGSVFMTTGGGVTFYNDYNSSKAHHGDGNDSTREGRTREISTQSANNDRLGRPTSTSSGAQNTAFRNAHFLNQKESKFVAAKDEIYIYNSRNTVKSNYEYPAVNQIAPSLQEHQNTLGTTSHSISSQVNSNGAQHVQVHSSVTESVTSTRSGPTTLRESFNRLTLNNEADKVLFELHREKTSAALYKVVQVEVRFDQMNGVPCSILTFRLQQGEDADKRCIAVCLKGKFTHDNWQYKKVYIKDISCFPDDGPVSLAEVEIQTTTQNTSEGTIGLTGLSPSLKARLSRMSSQQKTRVAGQHAHCEVTETEDEFNVHLTVDSALESEMSVVNPLLFSLFSRLEETRQPMKLELTLEVTYRPKRGGKKTLQEVHTEVYIGHERFDIHKI